ncbi:MAG: hypothetical protein OXJ53_01315 [Gammaproteobacteria bacterium]|nr:hypothetical protein [Gammaproteobacteria bacterium]MDE0271172.1 hypothetical protein [Gammaproteobacteria bacterium]
MVGVAGFYYFNGEFDNVSVTTQTPLLRLPARVATPILEAA